MKYISLILSFIMFLLPFFTPVVFAQEQPSVTVTVPTGLLSTPTPAASIDYTLPYPGLLPDNPLYFLKTFRDNVIGWLISDPAKKSSFDLLQADKRLESGVYLINEDKSKTPLALSTISKGENYMDDAIAKAQQVYAQGHDTTDLARQLRTATRKHAEVLTGLSTSIPASQITSLQVLQQRVNTLIHQADAIKVKKAK